MSENKNSEIRLTLGADGISRRKFLRIAGLVTGGLLVAAPTDAMAFWWFSRPSSRMEIPDEWRKQFGSQVADYIDFLHRLNLRHISVEQIVGAHLRTRGSVSNTLPPKQIWKNIRPTLRAADRLCEELGEPVRNIVSAYRSPAYNRRCPGARPQSLHVRNMALDLQFRSSPRRVAMVARELREKGVFTGGVGRYSSFTHIDTRGRKADW